MSKWFPIRVYANGFDDPVFARPSGCYAIYRDGFAVYVGQSEWLRERMLIQFKRFGMGAEPHRWAIKIRTDRFYAERATLELRLIRRLRPEFNVTGKSDSWSLFASSLPPRRELTS